MKITKISQGLTLIELIVTLSIMTILLTLSVSFFELNRRNHIEIAEQKIFTALQFARMSAISSRQTVIVCSSNLSTTLKVTLQDHHDFLRNIDLQGVHVRLQAFGDGQVIKFTPDGKSLTNGTFYLSTPQGILRTKIILHKSGRVRIERLGST